MRNPASGDLASSLCQMFCMLRCCPPPTGESSRSNRHSRLKESDDKKKEAAFPLFPENKGTPHTRLAERTQRCSLLAVSSLTAYCCSARLQSAERFPAEERGPSPLLLPSTCPARLIRMKTRCGRLVSLLSFHDVLLSFFLSLFFSRGTFTACFSAAFPSPGSHRARIGLDQ